MNKENCVLKLVDEIILYITGFYLNYQACKLHLCGACCISVVNCFFGLLGSVVFFFCKCLVNGTTFGGGGKKCYNLLHNCFGIVFKGEKFVKKFTYIFVVLHV